MPKSRGPQPSNLGLDRKGLLRKCLKASPNCFSTTPDRLSADNDDEDEDDEQDAGAASKWGEDIHSIPRWRYSRGAEPEEAFSKLSKAIDEYEPGQGGIDGGGFQVVTRDAKTRYTYVQFESLKRGYIDDLEAAVDADGSVQLVSSSRLGYLDFRVNAKRLNFLAARLRAQGFEAAEITAKTHPVYFESNPAPDQPSSSKGDGFGKKQY